jgi:hypothetical protein
MPTIQPKGPDHIPHVGPARGKKSEDIPSPEEMHLPKTAQTGKTADAGKLKEITADAKADSVMKKLSEQLNKLQGG